MTPRLVLSAYQCAPGKGSVSQIGWEWYSRLSRKVPVTLVTHVRNREALLAAGVPGFDEILFVDTEWFAGPLYRLAKAMFRRSEHAVFLVSSLDFFVFDRAAVGALRARWKQGARWDIAHAVTPVSPMAAGTLHRLRLPVILGPWNGGLTSPSAFPGIMRQDSAWLYRVRRLGRWADWMRGATKHAAAILTATAHTTACLPPECAARCIPMIENGVDFDLFTPSPWPEPPSAARPLEILFTGRLIPAKALPLLFGAISQVAADFPVRLTVIGDGPMRGEWAAASESCGLSGCVRFLGMQPLPAVAAAMRNAHVFCLPSVRESGGGVLLEAMASARPVIAVAHGGPAEIVDSEIGVAIPPDGPQQVTDGIAAALRDLVERPAVWRERGEAGRRRAAQRYGWDSKIGQALDLYDRILTASSPQGRPS